MLYTRIETKAVGCLVDVEGYGGCGRLVDDIIIHFPAAPPLEGAAVGIGRK